MRGNSLGDNSDYELAREINTLSLRSKPLAEVIEVYDRNKWSGGIIDGICYFFNEHRRAVVDACEDVIREKTREARDSELERLGNDHFRKLC